MTTQTVIDTQQTVNGDGSMTTVTTYSDGSTSTAWVPAPGSPQANAQTLQQRAAQALGANATYLGLTSPTTAQSAAQVKALTRQMNGLIRLLIANDTSAITDS